VRLREPCQTVLSKSSHCIIQLHATTMREPSKMRQTKCKISKLKVSPQAIMSLREIIRKGSYGNSGNESIVGLIRCKALPLPTHTRKQNMPITATRANFLKQQTREDTQTWIIAVRQDKETKEQTVQPSDADATCAMPGQYARRPPMQQSPTLQSRINVPETRLLLFRSREPQTHHKEVSCGRRPPKQVWVRPSANAQLPGHIETRAFISQRAITRQGEMRAGSEEPE
jgi:hypothetical protein